MAGNPNPSPKTRFKPGQSGNPGGKTSEHVAAERKSAQIAAQMRLKMLSSMQEKIDQGVDPMELISGDVIRLFKDSEDRAHGTPKAAIDHTSNDGSMTPKAIDAARLSTAALREIMGAVSDEAPEPDEG